MLPGSFIGYQRSRVSWGTSWRVESHQTGQRKAPGFFAAGAGEEGSGVDALVLCLTARSVKCHATYGVSELEDVLSRTRLGRYAGNTLDERLACYRWNVQLCQALYPTLHYVEIVLRNRMHAAFTLLRGTEWWFDDPALVHHPYAQREVADARSKVKGRAEVPGDIVAGVSFGFWRGFFFDAFETTWRHVVYDVFPHIPSSQANRKKLNARLEEIRRLRNRVFHHESVFNSDPEGRCNRAQEMLGWMSTAALAERRAIDTFVIVYTADPR